MRVAVLIKKTNVHPVSGMLTFWCPFLLISDYAPEKHWI